MLGPMSAKRVVIYMPEALLDAVNRATLASPHSRSDIICAALQRFLAGEPGPGVADFTSPDEAFFDRVTEEPRPKSKLWIN